LNLIITLNNAAEFFNFSNADKPERPARRIPAQGCTKVLPCDKSNRNFAPDVPVPQKEVNKSLKTSITISTSSMHRVGFYPSLSEMQLFSRFFHRVGLTTNPMLYLISPLAKCLTQCTMAIVNASFLYSVSQALFLISTELFRIILTGKKMLNYILKSSPRYILRASGSLINSSAFPSIKISPE